VRPAAIDSSNTFESASLSDGMTATSTLESSAGTSERSPVKITWSATPSRVANACSFGRYSRLFGAVSPMMRNRAAG
jgi:hypothetical protein